MAREEGFRLLAGQSELTKSLFNTRKNEHWFCRHCAVRGFGVGTETPIGRMVGACGAACAAPPGQRAVGLDINANHLRSVSAGWVEGIARPVHIGRTTQVWQIELRDEQGRLTCVSRITMAILAPAEPATLTTGGG